MPQLRILGILIGLLALAAAFDQFRKHKIRRLDLLFAIMVFSPLVAVSIYPDLANILLEMLSMKSQQHSRLIAILIFSNVFLWGVVLILRIRIHRRDQRFDLLVRSLGVDDFARTCGTDSGVRPITVVIPAFNETENIGDVLDRVPGEIQGVPVAALVIDDGSDDGTLDTAHRHGALIVRNKIRRGGGAALRLGYDIARKYGAKIVVTMDADGQHRPEEIGGLVEPILQGTADIVIGSRIMGVREKDSLVRLLGIHLFNRVINFMAHTRISDCSSGFRAFGVEQLNRILLLQDQFHTAELIIDAAKQGLRITEAPVTVLRRRFGYSKKGRNWRYGLNFTRTILKTWWR